ncbi:MAG: FG-GAP repeat protein [Polyangiaceae bacterium]
MRASPFILGLIGLSSLAASGCSWSRFDDITFDSPIVLFEKPGSMKTGFGVSLSTLTREGDTSVLVGGAVGASGAALYHIGDGESPGTTSVDSGYCTGGSAQCFLSSSFGAFANATSGISRPQCYAVGTGSVGDPGIMVRCLDATEYPLTIPPGALKLLDFSLRESQPYDYPMATDRTDDPVMLVTLPYQQLAWFYPSKSNKFSELSAPKGLIDSADKSFGNTLAVLHVGSSRVLAVGYPGKSEVLFWKTDGGAGSSYIGCLGGVPGLGRALAAGNVNKDDVNDLVISDDTNVNVIDGQALAALPETDSTECSFSSLPSGALLGSFGCGSSSSTSNCEGSAFGAAVAIGDLDNDGDGEVIVGAPQMTVRGKSSAGAVLVYDVETPADAALVEVKFLSSAESNDNLGAVLATPHIKGRDLIVAGAPGNGKAALFYCSSLLPHGAAGSRCP